MEEIQPETRFDELIEQLDLRLFERIPSQTTDLDKRSLLACQLAVRTLTQSYTYLEIGSYLGGSLQPYLFDAGCQHIVSIDKRPAAQPDERGFSYEYRNNSTERMLDKLKQIYSPGVAKIDCIDADASKIDAARIQFKPQLCFIDGEHTDEAAFSDFLFCMKVLDRSGLIVFHDAAVIYNGLSRVINYLEESGHHFHAYNLPETLFVVEINDFAAHQVACIREMLINNYVGYLASLRCNDHFRRFANRPIFRTLRNFKMKMKGGQVSS